MNRINPLHIIVLLCVVILFLFFKNMTLKEEVREEKNAFKESEHLALKLDSYKKMYTDKKHQQKALLRILAQPSLKNSKIVLAKGLKSWKITASSIKVNSLNSLLSKLLNGAYNIKGLKIDRIDAQHAKLYVEIVW